MPEQRKTLRPSIFISHDNPELPHTRYSFIYFVKFSHCRRLNLNWHHVAIHHEKTCNLETLLPEMLTGIGPYVCWRFLFNSNKHYVVVAGVERCTDYHGPVCMWKIFLWKVFRSMLSVCGRYSYKVLVECICNWPQIHPATSAQNFVQNCLHFFFPPPKLSGHKITHISGMYFFWHATQTIFFFSVSPVYWGETNYNSGMLHHVRYISQRDWLWKDK